MIKKLGLILMITALMLSGALACTGGQIIAQDGSVVFGRTLEFEKDIKSDVIVIPRNYELKAVSPYPGNGLIWKSKYAAVGTNAENQVMIVDGLNEKGMAVGSFYFPGVAKYQAVSQSEASNSLSSIDLGMWLLTNFVNINEVKDGLKKIKVSNAKFGPWNMTLPLHYIVTEPSGKSLVIEYVNGELHTFDNPIGVLTNAPTFDWQMINLNNYVNLQNEDINNKKIKQMDLTKTGLGSGLLGLPGDFTPPSRFVRIAFFTAYALPVADAKQAVYALFHLLNNFDIPKGSVKELFQGQNYYDVTQWTSVNDLKNKRYYIRSLNNQEIRMVDLTKFDLNSKQVKKLSLAGENPMNDISNQAIDMS